MKALSLAFVLTACGGSDKPNDPYLYCNSAQADGFMAVRGQTFYAATGGCEHASSAIGLSRAMLVRSGFTTDEELTHVRGGLTLSVLDVERWDAQGQMVGGLAEHNEILVGSTMWSTLHEQIHEVRIARGVSMADESAHAHWDEPGFGYVALTDFFVWKFIGYRVCNAQAPLTSAQVDGLRNLNGVSVDEWLAEPCP